jgi:hypothetical protein
MKTWRGGALSLALAILPCRAQLATPFLPAQQITPEQAAKRLAKVKTEYQQTIALLEVSSRKGWTLDEFHRALDAKLTRPRACEGYIQTLLRPRTIWDERLPFSVEVSQAITQCRNERDVIVQSLTLRAGAK